MKTNYSNLGGYDGSTDGVSANEILSKTIEIVNQTKSAKKENSFAEKLKASFLHFSCLVILIAATCWGNVFGQTTLSYTVAGTYTWICPPGVTSVTMTCIGGGGAGGGASATSRDGGGGGGGASVTLTNYAVTPGGSYTIVVGAGGLGVAANTGNSGTASTVSYQSTIFIKADFGLGGTRGASNSAAGAGGLGGIIANNIPANTGFKGGNGGNSDPATGSYDRSGGGGGGAGVTGAGGNAPNAATAGVGLASAAGTAGAGGLSGAGGVGRVSTGAAGSLGANGVAAGGGGGGSTVWSGANRAGGAGAAGTVTITIPCTAPGAPTAISGTTALCSPSTTTLTASGGTTGTEGLYLWYSSACPANAFAQHWSGNTNPYTPATTTVNSITGGVINLTSTSGDPNLNVTGLGSLTGTAARYVNIRYKVISGTAGSAEIFFYNTNNANTAVAGDMVSGTLISDNTWRILSIDMSADPQYALGGISGFRFDWTTATAVNMAIDFITMSSSPIIGEGTTYLTGTSGTYYSAVQNACGLSSCQSSTVTVNALPSAGTVTSNPASGPICDNTSVSASVSAGSGGAGTVTDEIQYMINGGAWTTYSAAVTATASSSTVAGSIQFRTRRTATGAGCTTSSYNTTTSIAVHNASIGWANLETQNGTICATTGSHTIRGRVWKDGYTSIAGADANFQVQVGYNSANTNPNGWSTWSAATWLEQTGNDDRYTATLTGLAAGTYYYAIRYRYLSCGTWYYGGYSGTGGGAYDGSANINGVLTVNASPTASAGAALSNICRGTSTAQMGGSVGGGATGATWSGGSGSWTNPTNASTAVYNAAANESGTITLTLTATAPTGCTSVTDSKTLTFTAVSSSPTITGPICPGNTTVSGTGVNGSTIKVIRGGSEIQSGSATWSGTSWSITVSSVSAGESLTATQTESGKCVSDASSAYVVITPASFGNIQSPATSQVICGSPVTFYGQVYRAATTEAAGQGASLTADLGWSATNTNPNTWTNWTSATFNTQSGNNDEFSADLGAGLTEGNWFYAFRYNYAGCTIYGGYGGIYGSGGSNGTATVPASQTAVLSSAAGTNAQTVCKGLSIVNITYTIGNGATNANVTGLPTGVTASLSGTTLTISGTVDHSNTAGVFTYSVTTSGTSNCPFTVNGTITAKESVDFANLQSPASGGVCTAGSFNVYGQVYEPGVTPGAGQGGGITVQAGYDASNTNPSTWSTWQSTTYNSTVTGSNDEYSSTFSSLNTDGVYYYAFKYTNNASGCVTYGGLNGTWDATTNVSGVMTVMGPTAGAIGSDQTLCNTGSGVTPSSFSSSTDGSSSGTISYEWQTNASGSYVTISGATGATYQAPTLTATTSYKRRTVATSGAVSCYSAYTSPVTVTVNNPISITLQPNTSAASVCLNGAAFTALTVNATGTSPTYQWQQSTDGSTNWITAVGGAGGTTSSYTPPNNLVGTLYYRCVVSGASPCSSVNSNPSGARNVLSLPTITSYSPATGCTGTTITINGTNFASGATTVTVNGITATAVTFVSSSQITVVQPAGVTGTGNIVVTIAGPCSATSSSTFSLLAVPAQPSAITGTANPEVGATAQAYSVTNVAGVTYTWSFPSGWTITSGQGTNSVQVTVGSVNGTISVTPSNCAGNGTATTLATTIPAYRAKFTGVNFGASDWCAGTSRSVTVNVTNTGTSTWTDAGPDINIGVKWNTNATNWNDYMYRQNAGGLAPGASQVYTFASLKASNATANVAPPSVPTYGTNLATGTNILSFDVVAEGCFWFSGNTANATCPGVVSGNSVYQSTSITITDVPAQPSAITGTASVCSNVSQSYSVTNVAGLTYNWTFPSGWTQTAGGTTNSVTVTTGAAGGSISVTAANTCGNSTARTLAVANAGPTSVSGGSDATTCYNVGTQLSGSATAPIVSGSTSATYSVGNANTLYAAAPTTATASSCPIPLSVTIPVGATITGVSVNYTMTAIGAAFKSDQRSYLKCTNSGGTTEAAVSSGTGGATGANPYSRTGLTIANAVSGGGTINFQLHAFRTYGGTGCTSTFNYVDNNTFTVTVFYTAPASITYAWSPTTGLSSSTISNPMATLTSNQTYTMTATSNGCSVAASDITITVRPEFTAGAIATTGETICAGGTPSEIGSTTAASGGDNSITYSWRSSADSYATAISGATSATYTPPSGLSTTTSYRRYAKDNTCNLTPTVATGTWTVTVNVTPSAGAIASAQSICSGNAPSAFTSSTDGTGTGTVSYEWQTNASGSYANISSGGASSTYQAPSLTATTSYQRRTVAISGGVTCYSTYTTPITVTVNDNPTLAGISASSVTLCTGDAATITLTGILNVAQTISYTIGGTSGTQTATVTGSGGTATLSTATLNVANSGQVITITGIARTDVTPSCAFTPISANTSVLPTVTACALITPSTNALTAFTACTNVASNEQSFAVEGSDLNADILVSAPTGFQVSSTSGSGFASSVSLTQSGGTVASTTIYVRMLSASTPTNANVALTSTGAVTQNIAVSGAVNQLLSAVTISGTSPQAICSNASGSVLTVSETNGGVITGRQWGYRTTSGGAITSISGATGTTYTPAGTALPAGIAYVVCTSTPTCGSATVSNEITVTTTALPTITASTPNFGCGTGTVGIAATASAGTIEWFNASTNGTSQGTSASAATWTTPSIASTTIYYAEAINATCRSTSRTAVTATITAIPTVTFTAQAAATACSSNDLTYTTQSGQSNYTWTFPGTLNTDYTIVSGGTTSSNTVTLQYLTAGSKTVSVNYSSSGCAAATATSSTATTVSLTPAAPTASDVSMCSPQQTSANLVAVSAGNMINWYDQSTGGALLTSLVASGSNYAVSPTGTTTYYAAAVTTPTSTSQTYPFPSTGVAQTFTVPNGVYSINVQMWGAGGAGGQFNATRINSGGSGGYVSGTLAVTPGQVLNLVVGSGGKVFPANTTSQYGGGGAGGSSSYYCGGGGGRSAIQFVSGTDYVTAGAGGGAGSARYSSSLLAVTGIAYGGAGGGAIGGSSGITYDCGAATGGTQSAGGTQAEAYGYNGGSGSLYTGGNGNTTYYGSGGGGGGYYGGAGGGCDGAYGYGNGGGGGSSYVANLTGTVVNTQGNTNTAGLLAAAPNNTFANYIAGVGIGGAGGTSNNGGNGLIVISYNQPVVGCISTTRTPVTVTINTQPTAPTAEVSVPAVVAPAVPTINVGGTVTLTSTAGANTLWYEAASGGTSIGSGSPFTSPVQCSPGNKTLYAEDNNGTCGSTRVAVSFVVRPMISSNPANALICQSGGSVTLSSQLTGGSAITWSPPNSNLSVYSGTSTVASPSTTTQYTMSATVTGCGSVSETKNVGVIDAVAFTPTATPSEVCAGNPVALASNLNSSGFTYTEIPISMATAVSPVVLCNACALDDGGWTDVPIPFTYNFFGNPYSFVNVGANGVLQFAASTGLAQYNYNSGNFPNAAYPENIIAAAAVDLYHSGGQVRYFTEGIAPTRKFIVEYFNSPGYNSGSNSVQIKLCETTGIVEVHVLNSSSVGYLGVANKVVGLQDLTKQIGATAYSSTATITSKAWKFVPGASYTFQWATGGSNITSANGGTSTNYTTPNLSAGDLTYSVAATNPNTGCTTTKDVAITVNALPAAPSSSGDITACSLAGNQSLVVTAGTGETADWYSSSSSTSILTSGDNVLSYSTGTAGTYYAAAQNTTTGCVSSTRTGVTLAVNTSPVAPTVTSPVTLCAGAQASVLTATATGSNTLNWYSAAPNSPAVTGATALGSAPTPATSSSGTTNYYVSQSSSSCESQLAQIAVTVNATPAAPVASNPSPYCEGAPAVALTATSTTGNTLYWYTVPTAGTGSTTAPTPSTSTAGATDYYVANRNTTSSCEGSRTTITVTVNPTITASVSNSASSTSACGGGAITFVATPTNGGTPTYQWYLNSSAISGETNDTLILATPNDADAIYVAMTPTAQTCLASTAAVNSSAVTLTSTPATPTVAIQSSASTAFCPGTSVTFSVNASANMGASPTYQWNLNGNPISGETNPTLVTTTLANNNQVTLTMTSSLSTLCLTSGNAVATSSAITSTVNSGVVITTPPVAAAACLGGTTSFTVSATGTGTLTYQWKKNGSNVIGNASATTATLTLSGIAAGDAANYTVVVTGTCGSVTSTAAALTINTATVISANPTAVTQCAGTTANFAVTASGQGTLTYQWRKDGSALTGETNATLAIANIATANVGQYSVIVSGGCGNATSTNALLTVNAATAISVNPVPVTQCAGTTVSFNVTASGTGSLSYQWKKDGSNVGTSINSLSIPNAQAANAGTYTVVVSSATCGSATSSGALLTVNPVTTISTQPVSIAGCEGLTSTFTVVAAGTTPLAYQWKFGGVDIAGATSASYSITNSSTANDGNYLVRVTGGCGAAVNSNSVTLNVFAQPTIASPTSTAYLCLNSAMTDITHATTNVTGIASMSGLPPGVTATYASNVISISGTPSSAGTYSYAVIPTGCTSDTATGTITTITTAQPSSVATATSATLIAGDLVWTGNSSTFWGLNSNWYEYDGTSFATPALGAAPTLSTRVFVLPSSTSGICISSSNNTTVTAAGAAKDVYIGAGATMLIDANQTLEVNGNWTNNGTFTPNATATTTFNGSGAQAIGGSSTSSFTNLTVNKTGGLLTLNKATNVSGTLTMTAGDISTTAANLLTVGTSAAAPGSLAWSSGSVLGPIKRWFSGTADATQASGIFPVGLSGVNRYAQVNYTSGLTTGGSITAEYKAGVCPILYAGLPTDVNGQMIQNYENEGYWSITPAGGDLNTAQYALKLRGNALTTVSSVAAMAQLRLIKSTTHTSWDNVGIGSNTGATGGVSDFTITNTGMTGFSWFNIGSGQISWLPIELTNFAANCNEKSQVDLKWSTASEQNSQNFIIERSRDLAAWEYVSTVNAAGNSNYNIDYSTVDTDPLSGVSYYRLLQVDNNGVETIYGPISVSCAGNENAMVVFPNPTKGNFTVEISSTEIFTNAQLQITDLTGKIIHQRSTNILEGKNQLTFEGLELQLGTYIINLTSVNGKINPVRVIVN